MKNQKIILMAFSVFLFGTAVSHAQTFDRVAISSGGITTDTINATIGEVFVFNASVNGVMSLNAGSQSDTSNTGGIPNYVPNLENKPAEMLVYPNPVDKYINLQINGLQTETVFFKVFDVNGKMVLQHSGNAVNKVFYIPVKQLSKGNYYIEGFAPTGETIGKIKFVKL